MSTVKSGLALVQNLYVLQIELAKFLQRDTHDADEEKKAKQDFKEFSSLMSEAKKKDVQAYMGGEDVFEALEELRSEFAVQMKKSSKPKRARAKKAA